MNATEQQMERIRRANVVAAAIENYAVAVAERVASGMWSSDEREFYREMQEALVAIQEPIE